MSVDTDDFKRAARERYLHARTIEIVEEMNCGDEQMRPAIAAAVEAICLEIAKLTYVVSELSEARSA